MIENVRCRIYNKDLNFDLDIPDFSSDVLARLFTEETAVNLPDRRIVLPENYVGWALESDKFGPPIKEVAEFIGITAERFAQILLLYIIAANKKATAIFSHPEVVGNKKNFLEAFGEFNRAYMVEPDKIKNTISPDIMLCAVCYTLMHEHRKNEFEIPANILPYMLTILNSEEDLKNFTPDVDADTTVYNPYKEEKRK